MELGVCGIDVRSQPPRRHTPSYCSSSFRSEEHSQYKKLMKFFWNTGVPVAAFGIFFKGVRLEQCAWHCCARRLEEWMLTIIIHCYW